jgi:hypothetical protein
MNPKFYKSKKETLLTCHMASVVGIVALFSCVSVQNSFAAGSLAVSTAQSDIVALQLGALELGYITTNNPLTPFVPSTNNAQQVVNALYQGRLALNTTTNNYASQTTNVVQNLQSTNFLQPTTFNFQSQILIATRMALLNGKYNTFTNSITNKVTLINGSQTTVSTVNLKASGATAAQIAQVAAGLGTAASHVPNYAPGLASYAVRAALNYTTTTVGNSNNIINVPVFGPFTIPKTIASTNDANATNAKTAATQLASATNAAGSLLIAACSTYAKGTTNWIGYPTNSGTTNQYGIIVTNPSVTSTRSLGYLPNFSTNPIPTSNLQNQQQPNLQGLAEAASAIASQAINGLGGTNVSNYGLYGASPSNVAIMTQSLIAAGSKFQNIAINQTYGGYNSGVLGADEFGIVTQLAGSNNSVIGFNSSSFSPYIVSLYNTNPLYNQSSILYGIIYGTVKALGTTASNNLAAASYGFGQGIYVSYLETCGLGSNALSSTAFWSSTNSSSISSMIIKAGITSPAIQTSMLSSMSNAIGAVWTDYTQGNMATNNPSFNLYSQYSRPMPGALGINVNGTRTNTTVAFINGIGSPVTDTFGL